MKQGRYASASSSKVATVLFRCRTIRLNICLNSSGLSSRGAFSAPPQTTGSHSDGTTSSGPLTRAVIKPSNSDRFCTAWSCSRDSRKPSSSSYSHSSSGLNKSSIGSRRLAANPCLQSSHCIKAKPRSETGVHTSSVPCRNNTARPAISTRSPASVHSRSPPRAETWRAFSCFLPSLCAQ